MSYKNTIYSLLLGIFFLLVSAANRFNFGASEPTLDMAPVVASDTEITPISAPSNTLPVPVTNFTSQKIVASRVKSTKSSSYIIIGGRTINIYNTNSLKDDAGSRVAKYGSGFYYGHRSSAFGIISALPDGTTFSITENGTTRTYRIARHETFLKTNNGANDILYLASEGANRNYANGIYSASYRGVKYDLALMTCAGASLGGGDATARYVAFAYRV